MSDACTTSFDTAASTSFALSPSNCTLRSTPKSYLAMTMGMARSHSRTMKGKLGLACFTGR